MPALNPIPTKGKRHGKKAFVPPYLRIGGKRSMLERAMKDRLLQGPGQKPRKEDSKGGDERTEALQPFPRLRKPAEVVEVELDQLRLQLHKELQERRRDARRRRQLRRRCRLQDSGSDGWVGRWMKMVDVC
eukprot:Skav214799  [mRNA]  locus=scaffold740:98630:99022:- [translate_table: standard]